MSETSKPKRPLGVTILAILSIFGGGYMVFSIVGFGIATPPVFEILSEMSLEELGHSIYSLVIGMFGIAVGSAMLIGKSWAWPAIIIMTIISLILVVILEVVGPGGNYLDIILGVIVLWYMRKSHVRAYFGQIK